MKKVVIAVGVAGLIYYFFFYNKNTAVIAGASAAPTNGAGTLNNPVAKRFQWGGVNLGPSFAQKAPGVASVS